MVGFNSNSPTPINDDNSTEAPKEYATNIVVKVPKTL
jgi:hypothetical protein